MSGVDSYDAVLAEQVAYYRSRASEYDRTSYGDPARVASRLEHVLDTLAPAGALLELACGTGVWTSLLGRRCRDLTAVDAAPEALAIARARCPAPVQFVCADLFTWNPDRTYDCAFCAFWLSHVPSRLLPGFLQRVTSWLSSGGRLLVVDQHAGAQTTEDRPEGDAEIAVRTLANGSTYRLVKVLLEPRVLVEQCSTVGLRAHVETDGDWLVAQIARQA